MLAGEPQAGHPARSQGAGGQAFAAEVWLEGQWAQGARLGSDDALLTGLGQGAGARVLAAGAMQGVVQRSGVQPCLALPKSERLAALAL